MKAIRIHKFGSTAEVLQYEEVPIPEPGPNELLIKVEAASLNRADLALTKGTYRIAPEELPVIPGREFAGTVAKLGAGVQEFKVGQRVVAYTGTGGYAEYALAKVSETLPVPDGVDSAAAAAMPTVFLTAWFGLLTDGKLKAGDWVLVQAGSSGVGIAAIQIAKHLGAKVITTSSGDDKCKRLRQLGADEAIDYTKQGFVAEIMRITGPAEGRDQAEHYQERLNPDVSRGRECASRLGHRPSGSSTAIPHLSRRRCRTRDDWRRHLPQELRSTSARRPLGFTRRSLRRSTGPTARSNRWAQGEPLLHHELSQGETRGLPRVG